MKLEESYEIKGCLRCGEKLYGKVETEGGQTYYGLYCKACNEWFIKKKGRIAPIFAELDHQIYQVILKNIDQVTRQDLIRMFAYIKPDFEKDIFMDEDYYDFVLMEDKKFCGLIEGELDETNYEFRIDMTRIEQAIETKEKELLLFEENAKETISYLGRIYFNEKFIEIRSGYPYHLHKKHPAI